MGLIRTCGCKWGLHKPIPMNSRLSFTELYVSLSAVFSLGTMWKVVGILVAVCVSSTVAPVPCSSRPDIIQKLPECYPNGKAPDQDIKYNTKNTLAYISNDVLPDGITSVVGKKIQGTPYTKALVTFKLASGSETTVTYDQDQRKDYVWEKDAQGKEYQIYPISKENHVYFYYRCIANGDQSATGTPMAAIYVECGHETEPEVQAEVNKALECTNSLQINNMKKMTLWPACATNP